MSLAALDPTKNRADATFGGGPFGWRCRGPVVGHVVACHVDGADVSTGPAMGIVAIGEHCVELASLASLDELVAIA
jgi:hypothetical protein